MSGPSTKSFWFQAIVNRNGVCTTRQGLLTDSQYAYQAMAALREMASEWNLPLMSAAIFEVTEDGEVGKQILRSSGSDTVYVASKSHTCDTVQPYRFGTTTREKVFVTLKLEESDEQRTL